MIKDTDLHLYLDRAPHIHVLKHTLQSSNFVLNKEVERTKTDPHTYFFAWKPPAITSAGFELIYFDSLFTDDLNLGNFEAFIILSGHQTSTGADLKMLDITAASLLEKYGGRLHNPQRIEKISTSYLLSGEQFSINSEKRLA